MLRRKIFVMAAVGAAGLLGAPAGASAYNDSLACQFTAITGSLSPAVPSALQLRLNTSGAYTFAGSGQCSYRGSVPLPTTISSSGGYRNTICGTGDFVGSATLSSSAFTATIGYRADHAAFTGAIDVQEVDGRPEQPSRRSTVDPPDYDGSFSLTPRQGNCVNADVSSWGIATDFVAVW